MPVVNEAAEPVATQAHPPEPDESKPIASEFAGDQSLEAAAVVSGAVSIDQTRKNHRDDSSAEAAPQPTRKSLYIVSGLAFLGVFVVLALLATQQKSFDHWQDQWSVWWADFSAPRPPQKNSGPIPRIPEETDIQLPVSSAKSAVGVFVPDSDALDTGTPGSAQSGPEDSLAPEAELLSSPGGLPDREGQSGNTKEGEQANGDDAGRENAAPVNGMMLIDEEAGLRQELTEDVQSVRADVAASAESPVGEISALDVTKDAVVAVIDKAWQVEFEFDSAELSTASVKVVGEALQYMSEAKGSIASIAGYSDNLGADQYNLSLSQRRAETVARYLADQGVSRSRLRVEGRGAIQVSASAEIDGLLSSNREWRMVEIRIIAPDQL